MATELAKAYVQIIPSAKGIQGNLAKAMDGEAASAGASSGMSFTDTFKKAVAAAGIGLALKKVIGDAFAEGGELQQNLGGTEAVFGQFANTIQSQATSAYKNMGMSASEYMATANKMGSLFQGSGVEQQRALDLTSQAMQRAADVASVMGLDTSAAMESIAGAAKGNFTMMDNLGVSMNATTLEAYALEKGMNFKWKTASNAEKAELAMKMFMDRTSQYAGNFARESEETWSGSIGSMKSAYKDLMANIMLGNDLGPSLTAMGNTITTFIGGNLIPAVINIAQGLPNAIITLIQNLVPQLISAYNNAVDATMNWFGSQFPKFLEQGAQTINNIVTGVLNTIPKVIQSASETQRNFLSTLNSYLPKILKSGIEIIVNVVSGILQQIPQVISSAGTMVTNFLTKGVFPMLPQVLQAGAELIIRIVNGIINNLPQIISSAATTIVKFVAAIGNNLPKILQSGIEIIGKLAAGLIQAIPNLVSKIPQIINSIKKAFTDVDWWSVGKNIIAGIANGLKNCGYQLWEAVKGVIGNFKDKVLAFFGIHSPSRWGEWVGKMIALGPPRGIVRNLNPMKRSVEMIAEVASNPLEDMFKSQNRTFPEQRTNNVIEKIDELIRLLKLILDKDIDKSEIKMYLNDREVGRALREMGVVFV